MFWRVARWIGHSDHINMTMRNDRVIGIGFNPQDPALTVPMDAPVGPMGQLFPVMAVLLAQVLDLDQATEESSR